MADRFGLAEARQTDGAASNEVADARFKLGERGKIDAGFLGGADFEQQRLFEHQRAVAADGAGFALLVGRRRWTPARWIDRHRPTSLSAASSASMSLSLTVSVTAITSPRSR